MENRTRFNKSRPIQMVTLLIVVLGLMLVPAISYASGLEEELTLESWMITPFESDFVEFDVQMENWMSTPFETEFEDFNISTEDWMISSWY